MLCHRVGYPCRKIFFKVIILAVEYLQLRKVTKDFHLSLIRLVNNFFLPYSIIDSYHFYWLVLR